MLTIMRFATKKHPDPKVRVPNFYNQQIIRG